jgi:hypothetical protein
MTVAGGGALELSTVTGIGAHYGWRRGGRPQGAERVARGGIHAAVAGQ